MDTRGQAESSGTAAASAENSQRVSDAAFTYDFLAILVAAQSDRASTKLLQLETVAFGCAGVLLYLCLASPPHIPFNLFDALVLGAIGASTFALHLILSGRLDTLGILIDRSSFDASGEAVSADERGNALYPHDRFGGRSGYDPLFLGHPVPLPNIRVRSDGAELTYEHFTVIMSRERRIAYVSASNYDTAQSRVSLWAVGGAEWKNDPRLEPGFHELGFLRACHV
jgi:hypothetical protein